MRLFSSATPTILLRRLLKCLGLVRILTPHKYVLNEAFHPVLDSLAGQMLTCLDDTNPQLTVSVLSGQSMRKEGTTTMPQPIFLNGLNGSTGQSLDDFQLTTEQLAKIARKKRLSAEELRKTKLR